MFRNLVVNFWARKTRRERVLLIIALFVCGAYGAVEFIYAPLLEKRSALKSAYAHASAELERAHDFAQSDHSAREMRSAREREEAERVRGEIGMMVATIEDLQERDFASGHSALSDKSAIGLARGVDEPLALSPCYPHQSALFSSQILECQAESSPKDSGGVSESTPHASLESSADSEIPSGEVYPLRDKNKIAHSRNLEGVAGERGKKIMVEGGGSSLANSSPSPLDEKEKGILNTNGVLEVKAKDSEKIESAIDSQSIDYRNSAPAESRNDSTRAARESHQDSESQKGKGGDSKIVDYRATDSKHQESGVLNIYALMSELINLANEQHINFSAIIPHAPTQSLTLQGSASFSQLKLLLARLESYRFTSLENLSLEPLTDISALDTPSGRNEGAHDESDEGDEGVRFSLLAQLYPPRAFLGEAR